jgi:hypothetical protein
VHRKKKTCRHTGRWSNARPARCITKCGIRSSMHEPWLSNVVSCLARLADKIRTGFHFVGTPSYRLA